MFVGRVAEIDAGRSLATFSVNSHLELLNLNMPRNLYQSGCVNTLYDANCTLNQASFAVAGTLSNVTSPATFNATLSQPAGFFNLGSITFTSGANAGLSRTVKSWGANTINLIAPFPVAPAIGDGFNIYPGCDKSQATCSAKFGNLKNFRGFPYVPENSTAV
jgi:uncharacterized phage protein (TIGR02218 family)